jgi:hypothetical protein
MRDKPVETGCGGYDQAEICGRPAVSAAVTGAARAECRTLTLAAPHRHDHGRSSGMWARSRWVFAAPTVQSRDASSVPDANQGCFRRVRSTAPPRVWLRETVDRSGGLGRIEAREQVRDQATTLASRDSLAAASSGCTRAL